MNLSKPPDILPEPPDDLKRHSERLTRLILERISSDGPISFATFMEMALYEPGLGYYSAGLHKFGAEGDFVTAPELGGVFAACLSRQVGELMAQLQVSDILEIGAGSGRLAAQLLNEIPAGSGKPTSSRKGQSPTSPRKGWSPCPGPGPTSRRPCRSYSILETSADLRAVQRRTLEALAAEQVDRVKWLDAPPREPWKGIVIANEVVDALPTERFRVKGGNVEQICVTAAGSDLEFCYRPAPRDLELAVKKLGPLPDDYRSEINPRLAPWVEAITSTLERGVALFIDYGYPASEFYMPERSDGTLIAHYRHRAHNDVLRFPGLQDLTAFVDFTALANAGRQAGLDLLGYTSQALFLMACGLEDVVSRGVRGDTAADMALNNEVRHLTLPGLMGEKFQVMALGRGWPESEPLLGFSFRDLRGRL